MIIGSKAVLVILWIFLSIFNWFLCFISHYLFCSVGITILVDVVKRFSKKVFMAEKNIQ